MKRIITSKTFWKDYAKWIGLTIPAFNFLLGILNKLKKFLKTNLILKDYTRLRNIIKWILDPENISWITLILVVIIYFSLYIYVKNRKSLELSLSSKKVIIKFGDLFTEESLKIIPVNEYFDTIVDNKIIAEETLHGLAITNIDLTVEEIDSKINEELSLILDLKSEESIRIRGKKTRYPLGTTIEIEGNYIFTALSRFNSRNRAYLKDRGEYVEFLSRFWRNINVIKNDRNISIPLFGSGNLNLTDGSFTYQELLIQILLSIKISGINMGHERKISIILHKNLRDDINLYEIKDLFNKGE